MDIIITHPNGWGLEQQQRLRTASIKAGLTTEGQAATQVKFLSEAEASIHFCIESLGLNSTVSPESKLVVCDAGGSTVDTTVYNVKSPRPKLELEEIKGSDCVQAGSIFVDEAASEYIRSALGRAGLRAVEVENCAKKGINAFISMIKPEFDGLKESVGCKVGEKTLNRARDGVHITNGRMRFLKHTVQSFFDPLVNEILDSAESQAEDIDNPYVFLVGGFGDSPYLQKCMKTRLGDSAKLTVNNKPGAKAVADGAVIWAIVQSVTSRAARYSYGVPVAIPYNRFSPEHTKREVGLGPGGIPLVLGGWSEIIGKNTVVSADSAIGVSYCRPFRTPRPTLSNFSAVLYSTTHLDDVEFMKDSDGSVKDGFYPVCTISANMQELEGALDPNYDMFGLYWELHFRVCIQFGDTELKAYLEWVDKEGEVCKGEASTIAASVL
ncbi:heat shock protein HSP70 family protein [Ceratobasidium sp. AG-Ba]|nr:heat shock protein HSP70 family protein [Ceratobasidium sp. AG-Ba]